MSMYFKSVDGDGPGTFEGVMSVPVMDRDGEILDAFCFNPLPKHITIDVDHGLTVEKTVGSGVPFYDAAGVLMVKGKFASTPLGQLTRTLVKEGHIRHMSVAFRAAVREVGKDGIVHIRKGDLINCTITGIPANPATLVSAKHSGLGMTPGLALARAKAELALTQAALLLDGRPDDAQLERDCDRVLRYSERVIARRRGDQLAARRADAVNAMRRAQ